MRLKFFLMLLKLLNADKNEQEYEEWIKFDGR